MENLAIHTADGVVLISHLLLHDERHGLEGAIEGYVDWILQLLVQIWLVVSLHRRE